MENKKLYNLGLICGRFSHMHLGHTSLIEASLNLCNHTLVLVGSSQESNTLRNPFKVDTRINVIKTAFSNVPEDTLTVKGINDLTNEFDFTVDWGGHVLDTAKSICGKDVDLMIYGNDEQRSKWFSKEQIKNIAELIVPRNAFPISATILRGYLLINDKASWEQNTPKSIHGMYEDLRGELLNVPIYSKIFEELNNTSKTIDDFMNIYKIYEKKDKEEKILNISNNS